MKKEIVMGKSIIEKKMSWHTSLFYAIALFLVVYNPPIYAGVSFSVLAVIASFFVILTNKNRAYDMLRTKGIKLCVRLFSIFFVYFLVVAFANFFLTAHEGIMLTISSHLVSYFSFFIVTFAIVVWMSKKHISFNQVCRLYILAGVLQTILVFVCLVSPGIKSFFNGLTAQNSNAEKIAIGLEFEAAYRNFGFASTLYDIFGFAMAILGVMAIVQALKGKKVYYVTALAFAIAAGVNARSGFLIFIAGAVILMMSHKGRVKASWLIRRVIFFILLFAGLSALFAWIVSDSSSEQLLWLASAVMETQSFSSGQSEGYYDTLMNDFIFFPDGLSLIFGTGMPPHLAINHNSDVGYIQNVWMYGIVGSVLVYAFYIKMFTMAIPKLSWPDSPMMKTILIMIAIYLVKLTCFGYSQASVIFGPLCFLAAYESKRMRVMHKGGPSE